MTAFISVLDDIYCGFAFFGYFLRFFFGFLMPLYASSSVTMWNKATFSVVVLVPKRGPDSDKIWLKRFGCNADIKFMACGNCVDLPWLAETFNLFLKILRPPAAFLFYDPSWSLFLFWKQGKWNHKNQNIAFLIQTNHGLLYITYRKPNTKNKFRKKNPQRIKNPEPKIKCKNCAKTQSKIDPWKP